MKTDDHGVAQKTRIATCPDNELGPSDLVEAIRARRGGGLLNLDRMLLNSPPFARGWNQFLGAVRNSLSLDAQLRELAICAVAILTRAPYEYQQHAPEYLTAGGTDEKLQALLEWAREEPQNKTGIFSEQEASVIALARAMTLQVQVDEQCFHRLQINLPDQQQQVELVGVIAAYNMVARFLEALEVQPEAEDLPHP